MPPFTGPTAAPEHPGLWFFGLNRSPYGNMHIRRREARQLARRIATSQRTPSERTSSIRKTGRHDHRPNSR